MVSGLKKPKHAGSAPLSDEALQYIEHPSNRLAAKVIEPEIFRLRRLSPVKRYRQMWIALNAVAGITESADHGALKRFRSGHTPLDRQYARAWEQAVEIIEMRVHLMYGVDIEVVLPAREDAPANSMHDASMQDYKLRKGVERQKMYEWFCDLPSEMPLMERYERTADEFCVHPRTARRAVEHCNLEENRDRQRITARQWKSKREAS